MKPVRTTKHDWAEYDATMVEQRHAAALADPDAQPWTEEQLANARRVSPTVMILRALKFSQEEFAARCRIPLELLRDRESLRTEPDIPTRVYLRVLAKLPEAVRHALR